MNANDDNVQKEMSLIFSFRGILRLFTRNEQFGPIEITEVISWYTRKVLTVDLFVDESVPEDNHTRVGLSRVNRYGGLNSCTDYRGPSDTTTVIVGRVNCTVSECKRTRNTRRFDSVRRILRINKAPSPTRNCCISFYLFTSRRENTPSRFPIPLVNTRSASTTPRPYARTPSVDYRNPSTPPCPQPRQDVYVCVAYNRKPDTPGESISVARTARDERFSGFPVFSWCPFVRRSGETVGHRVTLMTEHPPGGRC